MKIFYLCGWKSVKESGNDRKWLVRHKKRYLALTEPNIIITVMKNHLNGSKSAAAVNRPGHTIMFLPLSNQQIVFL